MGDKSTPENRVDINNETHYIEDDLDLEDTSADISLNKTGERGSGYHIRNDPSAPHQRQTVIERRGAIDIRCKSREVVHGYLSPESDDFASFLVYDLHIDPTKLARRVAWARITFEFSNSVPGAAGPEIYAIAPQGRFTTLPTTQEESFRKGGDVKVDTSPLGIKVGGSFKWEKTVKRTTSDHTMLVGSTVSNGYGKEVGADWVLHENKLTKDGVPSFMRIAMLLKRKDDNEFLSKVTVEVKADWKTELTHFFGSTQKDDPILFDPQLPPTNKLQKSGYNLESLDSIDIESCTDVTFSTIISNVVKPAVYTDGK